MEGFVIFIIGAIAMAFAMSMSEQQAQEKVKNFQDELHEKELEFKKKLQEELSTKEEE